MVRTKKSSDVVSNYANQYNEQPFKMPELNGGDDIKYEIGRLS